jgi:hypothetical protein
MTIAIFVILVGVAGLVALRFFGTRQVRLVRITRVAAPPQTVLDLVNQIDHMPEWYLPPGTLPRWLRAARFSVWGSTIQPRERLGWSSDPSRDPLQVRTIHGREFGYRRCALGALRYESVFRVTPAINAVETQLRWEIHYQLLRTVDALNPWFMRNAVWRVMDESIESIRKLSESVVDKPGWQKIHPMAS